MADKPWLRNRGKKKKKKKPADDQPFMLPMAVEPEFEYVPTATPNRTLLLYDEFMKRHANPVVLSHPESPERINRIYGALEAGGLVARCITACPDGVLAAAASVAAATAAGSSGGGGDNAAVAAADPAPADGATTDTAAAAVLATPSGDRLLLDADALLAHTPAYLKWIHHVEGLALDDRIALAKTLDSVFLNDVSVVVARFAAKLAANLAVELARAAQRGEALNGLAVVRPPGHHVEADHCLGFGLFNNIAVAARVAQREVPGTRVMIVDWDIHHGNGTQDIFEDDPSVLFVSLHGFLGGQYFPKGDAGSPARVGAGAGAGFNVNVGWGKLGRNDCDYLAAFRQVVLPLAAEFDPDVVFVSAGFDAAQYDPLGKCNVTPAGFAAMTRQLMTLAGGRVGLFLEGGYHLTALADSAVACVHALLGDECPPVTGVPDISAAQATPQGAADIQDTLRHHAPFWKFAAAAVPTAAEPTTNGGGGGGGGAAAAPAADGATPPAPGAGSAVPLPAAGTDDGAEEVEDAK